MNKKFIILCLSIILVLIVGTVFASNLIQFNQPLYYGEEQILFPAPTMKPLGEKSVTLQLLPYGIVALFASVGIVVGITLIKKHKQAFKTNFPKAICVLLCLLCLGTLVNPPAFADTNKFAPVDPSNYYGRKQLATMENGAALVFAYDQMVDGVENSATEISIRNPFHTITKDEWQVAMYSYLYDYPQHFWMGSSYRYSYFNGDNGEIIMEKILPNYIFSASELSDARNQFNAKANEILSTLSPSMDEYELELSIHDQLCDRIVYQESTHAHNAYGGLVTGLAVCEGYGKAFQYLLNQVGIESTLATGVGQPYGSTSLENHAWNFVKINGKYYYTDLTWDDQTSEAFYGYFNITTAMLSEDHALANYPYSFPEAKSLNDNYFTVNNAFVSSYNAEQITSLLQYNLKTHIYLTGPTSTFNTTLFNNSKTILNALDMVTSSSINISSLGRERLVTINGHRRGDVNADNILDEKDVALLDEYLNNPSAITNATCLKAADYNKDGKIDKKDSQTLSENIGGLSVKPESSVPQVPSEPTHPDSSSNTSSGITSAPLPTPSINLGDVNDDTLVNAKDALVVLKISVNKHQPTEAEKAAADVNKDSAINAKDALEILKKAVGKPCCF